MCGSKEITGRMVYTEYKCVCYVNGYEKLRKGDQVFLTGKQSAGIGYDKDGNAVLKLNVMVYQASGGFTAEERKARK